MTSKTPTLLRNITLVFLLAFSLSNAQAQMDLKTANEVLPVEVIFDETGTTNLVNGVAEIVINSEIADRLDSKRIEEMINVSLQLEGNCNGIYVSKKGKNSFVVTELNDGKSNARFSYKMTVKNK